MATSDLKKMQGYSALGVNLSRQKYGPLDVSTVLYSENDLKWYLSFSSTNKAGTGNKYTKSSAIPDDFKAYPYEGQVISVEVDGVVKVYVLGPEKATADPTTGLYFDYTELATSQTTSDLTALTSRVATAEGKLNTLQGDSSVAGSVAEAKKAADDAQDAADAVADRATKLEATHAKVGGTGSDKDNFKTVAEEVEAGIAAHAGEYAAKGYESKVDTLIGSDASKSARTIASEEVAKIVKDAPEAYDTLKEIADWIAAHPTDAAEYSSRIQTLEAICDGIGDTVNGEKATVVAYVTDAIAALKIGDYAKAADLTKLAARVLAVENKTAGDFTVGSGESATKDIKHYIDNKFSSVADTLGSLATEDEVTESLLATDLKAKINGKADMVTPATAGNFAGLDSNGNLTDSGSNASDFATKTQGSKADSAIQKVQVNSVDLTPDVNKVVNVTVATGTSDGTIKVNGTDVAVKGLKSAAYKADTEFDAAGAAEQAKTDVLGQAGYGQTVKSAYEKAESAEQLASGAVGSISSHESRHAPGKTVAQEVTAGIEALDLANTYAPKQATAEHISSTAVHLQDGERATWNTAANDVTTLKDAETVEGSVRNIAKSYADGKDDAIAGAKKAGTDAQSTIDTYKTENNTRVKAIEDSLAAGGATAEAIADAKKAGTDAQTAADTVAGLVGGTAVSTQITNAIEALDGQIVGSGFVKQISQIDGKVTATLGPINASEIPTGIDQSKISGLTDALAAKQDTVVWQSGNYDAATNKAITKSDLDAAVAGLAGAVHFIDIIPDTVIFKADTIEEAVQKYISSVASSYVPAIGDVFIWKSKEYIYASAGAAGGAGGSTTPTWYELGDETLYAVKGSIKDADIAADAAIAQSKIAGLVSDLSDKATVTALEAEVTNRTQADTALGNRIAAFETNGAHDVAALEGRVGTLEGKPAAGITSQQITNWDAAVDSIDDAVQAGVATLDYTDTAVAGQYVSSVSQTDGVISVTRVALPTATAAALGMVKVDNTSIEAAADGTISLKAVNVQKLYIADGDELILDGGHA